MTMPSRVFICIRNPGPQVVHDQHGHAAGSTSCDRPRSQGLDDPRLGLVMALLTAPRGDCSIAEYGDYPEPPQPGTRRERMGWYGRPGQADNGSGAGRRLTMGEALTIRVRRYRGYA